MTEKLAIEDYVYRELKQAIFNRKIPLNMQLNEKELSNAFNVSRTPIRTVLKKMEQEKIIENIPNKGAFIHQPTPQEIENVFQLRTILEREAAKIACKTVSEEQLDELERITIEEEQFFREGEYEKGLEKTTLFHQQLMDLSNNEYMKKYNEELINITNIYLAFHDSARKESPLSPEEHRSIIKALRTRDQEKAAESINSHYKNVREHLKYEEEEKKYSFEELFKPYR
ncbi:GntR family transcriptional regulator [Salinicoccus kekensis]|uniref:DNA-binding GntR family transcriptional regulator n=1 Tax=Salinicoccus kekensis TaxID=714307 RepID=A0A285UP79_9STAP|nr:GntR family transcriptional regulator [Salinicoccus kekensis]SOC43694.1 DNA-binding GntR family transcriptional regulator [Salinicoccus kekensis]